MRYILFFLIVLQIFSLFLSLVKTGDYRRFSKYFRFLSTIFGILFFAYWFTQKSNGNFLEKSMSIQVINKLNPVSYTHLDVYKRQGEIQITKPLQILLKNNILSIRSF